MNSQQPPICDKLKAMHEKEYKLDINRYDTEIEKNSKGVRLTLTHLGVSKEFSKLQQLLDRVDINALSF